MFQHSRDTFELNSGELIYNAKCKYMMTQKLVFTLSLSLMCLILNQAHAMKPAPFVKITHQDPKTQCTVVTDPDTVKTQVFDASKKELWSMDLFVGRKKMFLSPDCKTLLLFGSKYFGSTLKVNSEETVLDIYVLGKSQKHYTFQQVFGLTLPEVIQKYQVPQRGGGWISSSHFVTDTGVDWKARKFYVSFKDGIMGSSSF